MRSDIASGCGAERQSRRRFVVGSLADNNDVEAANRPIHVFDRDAGALGQCLEFVGAVDGVLGVVNAFIREVGEDDIQLP